MTQEHDNHPPASARAEIARQKMLSAALDVFGRYGVPFVLRSPAQIEGENNKLKIYSQRLTV
ncbi:hypothetical protein ACCS72_38430, partial [Rhizobium ruizarguesonis]